MVEYSVKDAAEILGLQEARLRYWAQTGFVSPSVRRKGRFYYTFQDLVGVKVAKELLDGGLSLQKVRKQVDALRRMLPEVDRPLAQLKICSDGNDLVVVERDVAFTPASGQVLMDLSLSALSLRLAEIHAIGPAAADDGRSAYQCFRDGCEAEGRGDCAAARADYERALRLDPALAAVHTNLGNLAAAEGDAVTARACYERALELDPEQPEARFNLGNALDDLDETELAIAALRQVCRQAPGFADAHFNLGLILARVGGLSQAREHVARYVELDPDSPWASQAREFLGQP